MKANKVYETIGKLTIHGMSSIYIKKHVLLIAHRNYLTTASTVEWVYDILTYDSEEYDLWVYEGHMDPKAKNIVEITGTDNLMKYLIKL